jgi:hypothetical protein
VVGSLAAALAFIITVLPLLPTRTIRLRTLARALSRPPVVVWSDAMWEDSRRLLGGLGFVVWLPPGHPHLPPHLSLRGRFLHSSRFLSHAEVASFGLAPRAQQVGQLEIAAAAAPYLSLPGAFVDQDVIHFVDNSSATYGLVKGSSPQDDSQRLIFSFHLRQVLDVFNVWFAYVASHANIADLPSRGALGEMATALRSVDSSFSLEGSAVRMELPDISDGWLERAATDLAAARGSRGVDRSSRGAKRRRA